MYRESFLRPSATMKWLPCQDRHISFIEMEVSDLSSFTNFLSHDADSVFADIPRRVEAVFLSLSSTYSNRNDASVPVTAPLSDQLFKSVQFL